ncbi:MAG: nitroreductase family protein [Minwuia sp.]|nr:nitroreductase family protein [Minwuia sp.]
MKTGSPSDTQNPAAEVARARRAFVARFGAAGNGFETDGKFTEVVETLLSHRTVRRFSDRAIAEDTMTAVIASGFSAPSKSDLQQASIIRVCNTELRAQIGALVPTMPWITGAPEFLVMLADGHRIRRVCELAEKTFQNDNLDNFVSAVSDASLVLQNMIVAAESYGLGCCPISVVRDHSDQISALLKLPPRVIPLAGLCIGWPADEGHISMRLPLAATVHVDSYDDTNLPALVGAYDRERDQRYSIPDARQKHPDAFGVAGFYSWSEDKARQMAFEERGNVGPFARQRDFSLR